jgi:hypothetical protein
MYSLELCRSIHADREREVERVMRRRRLLELLAIRSDDRDESGPGPRSRDPRPGPSGARALGQPG